MKWNSKKRKLAGTKRGDKKKKDLKTKEKTLKKKKKSAQRTTKQVSPCVSNRNEA